MKLAYRLPTALLLILSGFFLAQFFPVVPPASSVAAPAEAPLASGLVPRFIDFDIGAVTARNGATHQSHAGIPDLAPYLQLPDSGYPVSIASFTLPPDVSPDNELVARLIWSTSVAPCFFTLRAELVGYGADTSAAIYTVYWPGSSAPNVEGIIRNDTASRRQELLITFRPNPSFLPSPGDAMTLTLARDAADVNDTCASQILVRSISVTYQGINRYIPLVKK